MYKIATILGNRPQFIKASTVSEVIRSRSELNEIIIHSGQHYDYEMSEVFFEELNIPKPDYNLKIKSSSHAAMTGEIMVGLEEILKNEEPDIVLVYGDTNTTLAGAITTKKLNLKLAHVEAGLRSFNRRMPEEINRIVADRMSDVLYCPTESAVINLKREGFDDQHARICLCGDVMYDAVLKYAPQQKSHSDHPKRKILCTVHRAENTDDPSRLGNIVRALNDLSEHSEIYFPLHPRTKKQLDQFGLNLNFNTMEPMGYRELLTTLHAADLVITDSGGLQKESYFAKKGCVTVRDETEWTELVDAGVNFLSGTKTESIIKAVEDMRNKNLLFDQSFYGSGKASVIIVDDLIAKVLKA